MAAQDYTSLAEVRAFNQSLDYRVIRLGHSPITFIEAVARCFRILATLRGLRPSVVLATGERMVWLAAFLRRVTGVPLVSVGHGTEFSAASRWKRSLTTWAFNRSDFRVAVSEYTRSLMIAIGISADGSSVIPNGAEAGKFSPPPDPRRVRLREELIRETGYILLTVGNVTLRKGQDVVIRALPAVIERMGNVHYLIAGLPTMKPALERLAGDLGVSDHVHFLGRVNERELLEAYQACDVFVMTSRMTPEGDVEGYGIAVLEAALCGKPSIGTLESGLAEAIKAEETGLLVPQEDPESTAAAILRILGNEDLRKRMGENARQRVLNRATWEIRAHEYHKLLQHTGSPGKKL